MGIYLDSGYVNWPNIFGRGSTFNVSWGPRGGGKTFGALQYFIDQELPFIMLRRTSKIVERIQRPMLSPLVPLNEKLYKENPLRFETDGDGMTAILDSHDNFRGMLMSLVDVASIRGFSAPWCKWIFYDEYAKEKHERRITGESDAIFNAYETINRNRELEGEEPVRMLFCSNSETLQNPVFMGFNIIADAERLLKSDGQEVLTIKDRSITLVNFKYSPIADRKKDTALYKATTGTRFFDMAIENHFSLTPDANRKSENLKEYKLFATLGKLNIYRHKSARRVYVCTTKVGRAPEFATDIISIKRFRQQYPWFWGAYVDGLIIFEDLYCESLLTNYFGVNIM